MGMIFDLFKQDLNLKLNKIKMLKDITIIIILFYIKYI